MPLHTSDITSASNGVAQVRGSAPRSICFAPLFGDLCVLVCGRSPSLCVVAYSAARSGFRPRRSRSTTGVGVWSWAVVNDVVEQNPQSGETLVIQRERQRHPVRLGPEVPPRAGAYSPAAKAGPFVFVSGQVPRDPVTGQLVG